MLSIERSNEVLERAATLLRGGGLVAFPTETVYGLGAHALDPLAVARIYAAKSRPQSSPLIVHVANAEAAKQLALEWPGRAERLARAFWPGPLTLVLPKIPAIPDLVTAGLPSVGLRVPAHPLALALLQRCGLPLAAPSANRFTEVSPTTAQHVEQSLGDRVDLIVDGGSCAVGIESTVVSLVGDTPLLLRPGMIGREEIEQVLGEPLELLSEVRPEAHPSPGLSDRHYAPRTPLLLVSSPGELPARGRGILLAIEGSPAFPVSGGDHGVEKAPGSHPMPNHPAAYAQVLYHVLRSVDAQAWDWIAAEKPPQSSSWDGIADRLRRASQSNHPHLS